MDTKKVLVIDDEDFIRELVKDFLELENILCDEAEDVQAAVKLVKSHKYKLILLDRNLGNSKAENIIPELKEYSHDTPIVILTGDPQYDSSNLPKIGADSIIYKPFQVDGFMKKISLYLES